MASYLCNLLPQNTWTQSNQKIKKHFLKHLTAAAAKSLQQCPTLCDPIRWHPTRLPHPWDSPGKNTGVGCHFLLQCMKVKSEREVAQSCPTLGTPWIAAYQAPPSMGLIKPNCFFSKTIATLSGYSIIGTKQYL